MEKQRFSYCRARSPSSGNSCSSSGSFPETVPGSPSATESSSDRYKTELCRSFEEGGTCRYGNKCRFAHGRSEMRPLDRHPKYKTEFCRTYHSTGFCPYGQRCHFIHGDRGSPPLDAPSAELPGVVPIQDGCDERADERSMFGEEVGSSVAKGNSVDLHVANYRQLELFQGLQQECRLKTIGEVKESGLEGKLACWRRKLDAENRIRFFEMEKRQGAHVTVDELKERFHHSSGSSRLEPRILELELSAILQRRRSQLRCNSVGSSCETPPPAAFAAAALDSRTSSPLSSSADETRSPMMIGGSPPYSSFLLQDVIALPRSPLRHHHDYFLRNNNPTVNRFAVRAAAAAAAAASVSNISKHKDSLLSPLWSRGDGQNPSRSSVSGLESPHRLQFHSSSLSSGSRQPSSGPYFVFDAETLARLIRR